MPPPELLDPEQDTRADTRLAPRWRVLLHDDPVTTFEFVVDVLRRVFAKSPAEAQRITRAAHERGTALVTVTTLAEGELRCEQVRSLARPLGYPLTLTLEPDG